MTSKKRIIKIYQNWAERYNFILKVNVYALMGYRMNSYRKKAINSLNLKEGDVVVDLACGTGLNFPYLQKAIGPKGKIIGVDITDAMLEQAKKKIKDNGWKNVELVNSDIEKYKFPSHIDAVLSTLAFPYLSNYDNLIKKIYNVLPIDGRFAELNYKEPKGKLVKRILLKVLSPFGDNMEDYLNHHIRESVEKYFDKTYFQEFYLGTTYVVTGEKTKKG